jgi:hypothetical protein
MEWSGSRPVRSRLATGKALSTEGSVTRWVTALKGGDMTAAQLLWERYHRQLVALARHKLQSARRRGRRCPERLPQLLQGAARVIL